MSTYLYYKFSVPLWYLNNSSCLKPHILIHLFIKTVTRLLRGYTEPHNIPNTLADCSTCSGRVSFLSLVPSPTSTLAFYSLCLSELLRISVSLNFAFLGFSSINLKVIRKKKILFFFSPRAIFKPAHHIHVHHGLQLKTLPIHNYASHFSSVLRI